MTGPVIYLHPREYKERFTNPKSVWAHYPTPVTQEEIDAHKWCPVEGCYGGQWSEFHPWCYAHCCEYLGEAEVTRLSEEWAAAHPERAEELRKMYGPFTDEEKAEMDRKYGWIFAKSAADSQHPQ